MTVESLDVRFQGFQAYIDAQTHSRLNDENGMPLYSHPMDEWVLRGLKVIPTGVLERALDTEISLFYGDLLAESIFIDEKSFPDLFEILTRCTETLDIRVPHAVAGPTLSFNAFTAGTDEYQFIYITSGLVGHFTPAEAGFVVGHECGHIASKHMVYHTLLDLLMYRAERYVGRWGFLLRYPALLAWSRRSEITADRAGLLCCGDLAIAERSLMRLIAGHADVDDVDIDDYLRKNKEMQEYHGHTWWQLFSSHPIIPKRIKALRLFAQSELYYDLSGKPKPLARLLGRDELDRQVNQLVLP